MKGEMWQNEQSILTEDLNYAQLAKDDAITDRVKDFYSSGVLKGVLNELTFVVTPGETGKINILSGVVYTIDGERIALGDPSVQYPNVPVSPLTGTDGPSTMAPDGLGGVVSTPKSTGSLGVIITPNKVNHIFIKYLKETNTDYFTLKEDSVQKIYPKALDGYSIVVVAEDSAAIDPKTLVDSTHEFLGYVDFTNGLALSSDNFSYTNKVYSYLNDGLVTTTTPKSDKSDRTLVYTPETDISLSGHVKAIGSGTVSNSNPHGMSLSDLGLTGKSTEVHETEFHATGIIAPSYTSTVSALCGLVNSISGNSTDEFLVRKLVTDEYVLVKGVTFDSTILGSDSLISFKNGTVLVDNGTYTVYLDSVDLLVKVCSATPNGKSYTVKTAGVSTVREISPLSVLNDKRNVPLWRITFTYDIIAYPSTYGKPNSVISEVQGAPNFGISNFTNKIDLRVFGTTSTEQLQRDASTDLISINHNVSIDKHLYVQGVDITGVLAVLFPAGIVLPYAGGTVPTGFLLCDGSDVLRSAYPNLFSAIGIAHGNPNPNNLWFKLPDYRGRFLRGVDSGIGRDTDRLTRTAASAGGNIGDIVGSVEDDSIKTHHHSIVMQSSAGGGGTSGGYNLLFPSGSSNTGDTGTGETRPKNANVNYLIKV